MRQSRIEEHSESIDRFGICITLSLVRSLMSSVFLFPFRFRSAIGHRLPDGCVCVFVCVRDVRMKSTMRVYFSCKPLMFSHFVVFILFFLAYSNVLVETIIH